MKAFIITAATFLFLASPSFALVRVKLPDPMPQVITGDCPTSPPESIPCFVGGNQYKIYFGDYDAPFEMMHELGHAYDYLYLDDGERHSFARHLELTNPWYVAPDPSKTLIQNANRTHNNVPGEEFADKYAECRLFKWNREHDRLCAWIKRAGLDRAD